MGVEMINISLIWQSMPALLHGTIITLKIACYSAAFGFIIGTLLGVLQAHACRTIKFVISVYTTIIRGTPMLFQIIIFVYVLPLPLSEIQSAILALAINSSAYICEIVRGGILSIAKGQFEAAHMLGLSTWHTYRFIIIPQTLHTLIPTFGNELMLLIKDSSLASTVGIAELFKQGTIVISQHYDALSIYAIVGLIYLLLTSIVSCITHYIQKQVHHA
jgi:His/Glu/Gln/Arg/opine family amino acid ABC transporter permease subunit